MTQRLPLLLLLAACGTATELPASPDAPVQDKDDLDPDTEVAPEFANPDVAVDLDPDDAVLHVQLEASITSTGYAYNEQVPGPTLRAKVGDLLRVDLTNNLDDPTTIHWHGIDAPYAMDGVTWEHDPVMPGETFVYELTLDRSGTYWYHPHFDTDKQVDRGLYGVLIVDDPAEPVADNDLIMVFDSLGEFDDQGGEDHHGFHFLPAWWTINGHRPSAVLVPDGTSVRARLLNVSNTGYLAIPGTHWRRIGSDQGLLAQADTPDTIVIGPGDRAELELMHGEDFELVTEPWTLAGPATYTGISELLVPFVVGAPSSPLDYPFSGQTPTADPPYTDIVYVFQGEPHTGEWLINGESFPDITVEHIDQGDVAIVEVRNLSPTEHPFHIHGNPFEVLSINGEPPAWRTMEDTLNLAPYDRARLRIVATNPGKWMTHCHILPHAEGGMMTVMDVN